MEKTAHTAYNSTTCFYNTPKDCNEIIGVKIKTWDDWEDVKYLPVMKQDKLVGFALGVIFLEPVKDGIKLTYK